MDATYVTGPAKGLLAFAELARNGDGGLPRVEFSFITPHRGQGRPDNPFVEAAERLGIPVDVVYETGPYDVRVIPQMRRIVEMRQPDILQTHNVKPHFFMRLSQLWRRYCWIAIHHGYVTTDFKTRCYNQLDRWSYRAPQHIITVCREFEGELEGMGIPAGRISVVGNAIRPWGPLTAVAVKKVFDLRRSPGVAVLVCIGRLSQEKGHVDLVRALGILRRQGSDKFHLYLVGEGPARGRIERALREEKLEEHVTLEGLQLDVRPYYEAADLVVLPSHSEGPSNVLLEAMMAERPVVATSVGGIPEVVTHEESALLVEPRNPAALAAGIHRALNDPQQDRLGRVAAAKARALTFSPKGRCRALIEIYETVLSSRER
jgi:glycosyltransferase involved in cell wall biosynthesis